MSIDNVTPDEWNTINRELQKDDGNTIHLKDDVNHPVHYNNGKVECIEAIDAASTKEEFEGYLRGNVLKYVWRFRYKDNVKDLQKAKWYLEKLISEVTKV
tara:strand:- start:4 stop:303 length:300 start_codon:yes stop_codon:yes gene_type:complete